MTSLAFDIPAASSGPLKTAEAAPLPVLDVLRNPVLDVLNLDTVIRSNSSGTHFERFPLASSVPVPNRLGLRERFVLSHSAALQPLTADVRGPR
jgi:hypothetical protein